MIVNLKVYPTDTCLFLTIQKVASTLLSSLIDDSEKTGLGFDYSLNIETKEVYPAESIPTKIRETILKDFDDIFSNKSDKNIVVLYRNPENRLKSSIIEDFNNLIVGQERSEFTLELLYKLFNASSDSQLFLNNNAHSLYLSKIDENDIELNEFLKKTFKFYIEYLSKLNFNNTHSANYLENFYKMITSNIFDESKLILCDIDSKLLTPLLNSLSITPDYKNHTHSNKVLLPIIDSVLLNISNTDTYLKYEEKINSEYEFYELLKKNSNNFKIQI